MEQINEFVNQVVSEMVASGKLEAMIREKVEKSLDSVFTEMFRSYGGVTKQIEEGLADAIKLDFKNFNLHTYNALIMEFIKATALKHMKNAAQSQLLEQLDDMLAPAPAEITVQELIQPYIDEWKEEPWDCDEYASVKITNEDGILSYFDLKMWRKKSERSLFNDRAPDPDLDLHIHDDGRIGIIRDHLQNFGTTNFNGDARIFQMYAAGTRVIDIADCDPDELDTALAAID